MISNYIIIRTPEHKNGKVHKWNRQIGTIDDNMLFVPFFESFYGYRVQFHSLEDIAKYTVQPEPEPKRLTLNQKFRKMLISEKGYDILKAIGYWTIVIVCCIILVGMAVNLLFKKYIL